MDIQVTARHFNASRELQEQIIGKIEKLERFNDQITDANVILDAEKKGIRSVELRMNIREKAVSVRAQEENMGKAIDSMLQKMERVLKKEKQKRKEHHAEPISNIVN